jgi:peptide/nickel transport system substrate-binding protein
MTLLQPFPPMLGILSMQYCSIVPRVVAEKYGKDFRRHPVGTGAFTCKTWKENEVLVLLANENYWEKSPSGEQFPLIDGIRVSFIENKRNAFLKFLEGDLDMISGIDPTYKDDVLTKTGELKPELTDKIQLLRSPYMNTEYLGFNLDPKLQGNKDLLNVKVRQAINYGFDRQKMMQFLRNNIGMPAISGFVPKGFPSFDSKKVVGYTYNPQKARTLLAEAGFPNGKGLTPITLETTNSYQDLCIFIQNQLQEIGIKVNIELHPPAFLREKTAKGEADFFRASWIGDYPDAETYLTVLYGGNPAPPNYTRFNHPAYNEAYKKALQTTNVEQAQALYQEMDRIIIEQAPIVPLYYDEVLRFTQKNVQHLGVNTFNLLTLKNVALAP